MKEQIFAILKKEIPEEVKIEVEIPENSEQGYYSTNVAFVLGKQKKVAPLKVAEELAQTILKKHNDLFETVSAAAPGFLNFRIRKEVVQKELEVILQKRDLYGKKAKGWFPKKAQVEYISANPTGPLTLANGRGGFFGDVLSNVLSWAGWKVEREYYVNDTGRQVETLGKSLLAALGFIEKEEEFYKGEYIQTWAETHHEIAEELKNYPMQLGQRAAKDFLKMIQDTVQEKAKIRFDRFTSEEKNIHQQLFIPRTLAIFKKKKVGYESEGALWLKTTLEGDDKDRVLITKEGAPTYFLADSAHYLETKKRGFDMKINILGPDHYGYVRRIQAAAKWIGLKESHVLITQAVRLLRGGTEAKMSKRKGEFVTFEELVEDVGMDAARFFFLMIAPETHMDFDLDLAKERSQKNPVYYAQYAYVRAENILEKFGKFSTRANLSLLITPEDTALILKLIQFPEILTETAKDFHVHRIPRYALDLARTFHDFYEKERIVGENADLASARAKLVEGTAIVFKNLFKVLGITAPKKM